MHRFMIDEWLPRAMQTPRVSAQALGNLAALKHVYAYIHTCIHTYIHT